MKLIRSGVALAVVGVMSLGGLSPASTADNLIVRKVDTSAYPNVAITALPATVGGTNTIRVRENGVDVQGAQISTFAEASVPTGIALVIDSSEASRENDALAKEKEAALAMVKAKAPGQKFAIVAYNNSARPVVNLTDDTELLTNAINSLEPSGQPALWDGIRLAGSMLQNQPELQPNVVLVTAGKNVKSNNDADGALGSLRDSKAALFSVVIRQRSGANAEELKELAAKTGGRYLETVSASEATSMLTGIRKNLDEQALIKYTSNSAKATLDIELVQGETSTVVHTAKGNVAQGAEVSPAVVDNSMIPSFLGGWTGLLIIFVVTAAALGLLVYGLIEIIGSERNQLSRALRPYSEDGTERGISKLADSDIIKKAVAQTGRIAQERGVLVAVEQRLQQADLPLKPAEAIFFTGVAALVAMLLGFLFFQLLGLALAGLLFAYMPVLVTNVMAKRRRKKFTSQLPDTLQLLSGSLRAGYSLLQGLDAVAQQTDAPMGTELQRALSEARLGRPVDEALQEVADRMGSDDFQWAVMAIKIKREVGGNLAELLLTVADTMTARERLRREVKGLTAEGRMSAWVLLALPPGIAGIISVLNKGYIEPLFNTTIGNMALVAAAVMMGIGYWLMMKLIEIEV